MGLLEDVLGEERPSMYDVLDEHQGEYGDEIANLVFCIENDLLVERAAEDYYRKHGWDQRMIDGRLKEGKIFTKIISSKEGFAWLARNLASFINYLRDRSISLNDGKKR